MFHKSNYGLFKETGMRTVTVIDRPNARIVIVREDGVEIDRIESIYRPELGGYSPSIETGDAVIDAELSAPVKPWDRPGDQSGRPGCW
jgi:hypothetical protein